MSDLNTEQLNNIPIDKYERQKQKRAARETEIVKARRKRTVKKTAYWIIGIVVMVGGIWLLASATGPKGTDYSQAYSILGRNHVPDGSTVSYNSNPPTSGDHYAGAAPTRFYDRELPDEQLVHNLEHSHIWIAYKPSLSSEIIESLKDFSGGNVIVTPRSKNDADVALVAWGRLDKFNIETNDIDEQRIKDFISRYQNRGPERVNVPRGHLR